MSNEFNFRIYLLGVIWVVFGNDVHKYHAYDPQCWLWKHILAWILKILLGSIANIWHNHSIFTVENHLFQIDEYFEVLCKHWVSWALANLFEFHSLIEKTTFYHQRDYGYFESFSCILHPWLHLFYMVHKMALLW